MSGTGLNGNFEVKRVDDAYCVGTCIVRMSACYPAAGVHGIAIVDIVSMHWYNACDIDSGRDVHPVTPSVRSASQVKSCAHFFDGL